VKFREQSSAVKAGVVALAVLLIILVFLLGLSLSPSTQSVLNDNQHPVSILVTLAFIAGGFLAWFTRDAKRQRQRAADISTVGMSALVDPLLEIGLNLYALRRDPRSVVEAWEKAMKEPNPPTRLKWEYGRALRSADNLGVWKPEWAKLDLDQRARLVTSQMCDQAVRRLMGSLRSWADLLAVTSLGETAMVALADLRLRLFGLSETCTDETKPIADQISECALRCLLLAMIFEACGGASQPRTGFVPPLNTWSMPEGPWMNKVWAEPFKTGESCDLTSPVDSGLALLSTYGERLTRSGKNGTILSSTSVPGLSGTGKASSQVVP